jgi:hypothetical protein
VRPRALLHATAICLLLAAATVWATPVSLFKLLARSQKSQQALRLLRAGKTQEALPILKDVIKAKRVENTPEAIALATELEDQVRTAKYGSAVKTLEQSLKQVLDPHFELLRNIDSGVSRVSVVEGRVKRFSKDFAAGARDPDHFLSDVKLARPALLSEWLAAPREKRVFVIGAGEDSAKISEFAESLKSDRYAVFFYDFCRRSGALCSNEAVGAIGTSGLTLLYHTPSATLSKYVTVEVATARFLEGLDRRVILIASPDLLAAFGGANFTMHVADMATSSPVE